METINSVFDNIKGLTVDEMLANPAYLPEKVLTAMDGREVERLFFRTENVASNVFAYRERRPYYLEDDVMKTAEFGEIPVDDPREDEYKTGKVDKYTKGIRVSWEQRKDDDRDAVARELAARTNTILRSRAREAQAALDAAETQELAAAVAWDQPGAKPASDILDAIELIQGAEDEDGNYFEYEPNVLWVHPTTLTMLKRNEEVQKLYIGDMASENPLFKGVSEQPLLFGQLQSAPSFAVPKDKLWIGVEGAGVQAQREDEQITDFYAEGGDSHLAGPHMSWRSDYSHRRGFVVDSPKGIVELTGLVTS